MGRASLEENSRSIDIRAAAPLHVYITTIQDDAARVIRTGPKDIRSCSQDVEDTGAVQAPAVFVRVKDVTGNIGVGSEIIRAAGTTTVLKVKKRCSSRKRRWGSADSRFHHRRSSRWGR